MCSDPVWTYSRDPKRFIAALELPGSLLAVMLLAERWPRKSRGLCRVTGATDNQGSSHIIKKMISTNLPRPRLLPEGTEQLRKYRMSLDLEWTRRDQNQEAGALTDWGFEDFDPGSKVLSRPGGPSLVNPTRAAGIQHRDV